ncbi:MAG: hypothetical protein WBE31_02650, partial [Candidatus Sulfotelmatobacter sp.]
APQRTSDPLLAERAVPVEPAALKKAVTHHAVAEQKKDDSQDNYKKELSSSERGRLSSSRVRRIQWVGHKINSNHPDQF